MDYKNFICIFMLQDPSEGAALGMSILQHLAINKRALLTFATTHHGELKTLKYRGEESGGKYFENASVEFDDIEMRPTFRLIWGIAGNSNALTVAKRLGLDESVVRQAQDALAGGGGIRDEKGEMRDVHGLLEGIEKDRIAAETAARRTEEALRMAEEKVEMANEMLADAREMQRTGREKAEEQVEREVRKAREKINEVVRNMQKGGGSAKAAGVAQKELEGLFATEVGGDQVLVEDVRIGDWITVGRLGGGEAEVVGMVGQREVVVGIGGMRAKVGVREISKVRRGGSSRARGRGSTDGVVAASVEVRTGGGRGGGGKETMKTAGNTVDIRGERVDEGVRRVEKGIDRAVGGGGNAVWIVHGFGTGRLKKGVREYLSACDLVKDMYDAESTDGGAGVTVAVLK